MPERDRYIDRFDGNPLEDMDPESAYRHIRWGRDPEDLYEIESPEPMVSLGQLARLDFEEGETIQWDEGDAPYIGVGLESNRLYVLPEAEGGGPIDVPELDRFRLVGDVERLDYYADKGDEHGYYYHHHDEPFPRLLEDGATGAMVLEPAELDGELPSYIVDEEGIIG